MIRRFLMRRAYNSGNWEKARNYALKIINRSKEQELARSVVIRSYWNQENYSQVIKLNLLWGNKFQELSERANYSLQKSISPDSKSYHPKVIKIQKNQPKPKTDSKKWNDEELVDNFWQEGTRLWMIHPNGWTFWDMPEEFQLSETHPDLLKLTSEVLLSPWNKSTKRPLEGTRKIGKIPALAFSAGTDSTAASFLMPENTILGYHRRSFEGILNHKNADRLLQHMKHDRKKTVIDISSNHELIRTYHFKQSGFSSDFASAAHLILLADHFDIGAIAFGMPIDNSWLMKGRKFREFTETHYFKYWKNRFLEAGIELFLPLAGISEAGAMKICQNEEIIPYMNSCLRGDGQNGCGNCWKCFHKNGPLGREFNFKVKEIQTFLHRKPMPTAVHALWAIHQLKLESEVPELSKLLELDLSWWTSYYPPAKEIIPNRWKEETWEKIQHHLTPMRPPYPVESINLYNE